MNLAELVISVLERGLVLVLKLEGPPGNRHLAIGIGLPETADALLLALGVAYMRRSQSFSDPEYWDAS